MLILGFIFAPVAWLIGIPWHSAHQVGNLLGTRTVTNELVAYRAAGRAEVLARRQILYHRDVCPVRICQL